MKEKIEILKDSGYIFELDADKAIGYHVQFFTADEKGDRDMDDYYEAYSDIGFEEAFEEAYFMWEQRHQDKTGSGEEDSHEGNGVIRDEVSHETLESGIDSLRE